MIEKIVFISLIIFVGCIPPSNQEFGPNIESYQEFEDCEPCPLLLNFASSNYQTQDWIGAIKNYNQLLKCNCGQLDPENTYKYMAYSYQQLGYYDSAAYIFKQGLKYTSDDVDLLKMAGNNSGRLDNIEDQIYYFDKILTIEENNLEVLELLSNVYRDQGMFEEQINILNIWLKYDPSSKNANAEKKAAFSALGKDESDVDRERWESDASNIQYGLDYIQSLERVSNYEKIVDVCNELMVYEKYNTKILRSLGDAYLNLYKEDDALNIYKSLAKVSPANYNVAIDISKILVNNEEYRKAMNWAEKAVSLSGNKGDAIYQRAEVYFALAESCSGNPPTFWDKIVYELSWEDYKEASNKGYNQAKSRRNFVGDNFITTVGDWHINRPEHETEVTPQGDCYSWITKSIKRKK